jgi:hypothetical protein
MWSRAEPLPEKVYGAAAAATRSGWCFITGGTTVGGIRSNAAREATFLGPAPRGRYSRLIDLGSDQRGDGVLFHAGTEGGATNLTYAMAPAGTAVFDSRTAIGGAESGVLYSGGMGCRRYLWTSFDFDDTLVTTTSDDWSAERRRLFDYSLPYRTCGAKIAYLSHTLIDSCPVGGPGNSNGGADPGENVVLQLTAKNVGSLAVSNVSATVTTSTPGVTITDGTATFPNMPVNATATSLAPHFSFTVDVGVACPSSIVFDVAFTSSQGSWNESVTLDLGAPVVTLFQEDFENGLEGSWTVENSGAGPGAWLSWTLDNLGDRSIGPPMADLWPIADTTVVGPGTTTFHEMLRSPLFDVAGHSTLTLSFDHQFQEGGGADAQVWASTDMGSSWGEHIASIGDSEGIPTPVARTIDLSEMAGAEQLRLNLRFADFSGTGTSWWALDNLRVTGGAGGCIPCNLTAPGDVSLLSWNGSSQLGWTATAGAAWYTVYRGIPSDLPGLLDPTLDSCQRFIGNGLNTGDVLTELPAPGTFWWYLVLGANAAGEGTAGNASSGPRTLNSTGPCS